ncbi:3-deoxy-7-phosphoheptulonate synthase [Lignipirellula cremea]|uniref:Phospho-2-dehydro-3-deoxyheptonate aldolase n=1 Tax=Lignipirellula cremea TaxID=2528010 RepID=A0A518DT41_9BACT|nr:3-deoxy-7-phosphoheptulonate synthase [Lignipirellula cremea]QDU95016.1 Phospho-2-dehydro-3-deoxyheptonate aldolase [Lignipirellula cremea]
MIVVMEKHATEEQVSHMVEKVEALGLKAHVIVGAERTVIAAIGDKREETKQSLESGAGVSAVMPILAPFKVASREVKPEPTQVKTGSLTIGDGVLGVIAGPCSVESEEQIIRSAQAVKAAGATALRGGAFKPRTSPYSFQGLKEHGLQLLAAARDATGLAIVTEVMGTDDVDLVARYADVLQIGARNMQNYRLLEAVGGAGKPVLLKRGPCATMEELLLAAEYILNEGNPNVILCERGIRTFETHTRFTLPLATVPYLRQITHLPIVTDPSHGTGHTRLVPDMAAASIAAGADGLILEVHPDPENAMSDGYQSLNFQQFEQTMELCRKVAEALGKKMGAAVPVA